MTGEKALLDYLKSFQLLPGCTPRLKDAQLHSTIFAKFLKGTDGHTIPLGLRIGDGDYWPGIIAGGNVKEFDLHFLVTCYARSAGKDFTERAAAREIAAELAHEVFLALSADRTLNTQVCDNTQVLMIQRGFDDENAAPYGVAQMAILINSTGRQLPRPWV
jgi:hypothetical protein